jgi:hypothetical protein
MSGLHNKNIIFYSNYSHDKLSSVCLQEISKNETVKNQFILLCVHDLYSPGNPPPYRLPKKISELSEKGLTPILCISGFKNYILGNAALNWLKTNSEKELNGGVEGYSVESSGIADNCSTIDQTEIVGMDHFNEEYNLCFSTGRGEVGKSYSNIEEVQQSQITTYDADDGAGNGGTEKKRAAIEMQKRLDRLQSQRREESTPQVGPYAQPNNSLAQRQFFNPNERSNEMPRMPIQNQSASSMPRMPNMPLMPRMNQQQQFQYSQPSQQSQQHQQQHQQNMPIYSQNKF